MSNKVFFTKSQLLSLFKKGLNEEISDWKNRYNFDFRFVEDSFRMVFNDVLEAGQFILEEFHPNKGDQISETFPLYSNISIKVVEPWDLVDTPLKGASFEVELIDSFKGRRSNIFKDRWESLKSLSKKLSRKYNLHITPTKSLSFYWRLIEGTSHNIDVNRFLLDNFGGKYKGSSVVDISRNLTLNMNRIENYFEMYTFVEKKEATVENSTKNILNLCSFYRDLIYKLPWWCAFNGDIQYGTHNLEAMEIYTYKKIKHHFRLLNAEDVIWKWERNAINFVGEVPMVEFVHIKSREADVLDGLERYIRELKGEEEEF